MFHHLGSNEVSLRRNQHVRLTLLPPDGCSEILPPSGEGREQNIGELLVGLASLPYLPIQPPLLKDCFFLLLWSYFIPRDLLHETVGSTYRAAMAHACVPDDRWHNRSIGCRPASKARE